MKFDILELEQLGSTNAYARGLLQNSDAGEGTLVWAREQYAGRGQGDNQWFSERGSSLTFSVILRPSFLLPGLQFMLNKVVTIAVLKTIRNFTAREQNACIKWPNDIYAGNGKLAGILIEHNIVSDHIQGSIVGVGINLNQEKFPAALPNPVSLKQITGNDFDARDVLELYCGNLDLDYARLEMNGYDGIDSEYDACLFGFREKMNFTSGGLTFTGEIKGVDEYGRLCVKDPDGRIRAFNHGEINQNRE
jgi:BirA family biotin operon repressor/biotin-[acetyl-CoA-carboxylase] ligase